MPYFEKKVNGLSLLKNAGISINVNEVDANNQTALHVAASNDDLVGAEWLIAEGADIGLKDINGYTPLQLAAKHSKTQLVAYFMQLNLPSEVSTTAYQAEVFCYTLGLIVTTFEDIAPTIETFLKHGLNINALNTEGLTPLQFIIRLISQPKYSHLYDNKLAERYGKVIKFLFKYGADKETIYQGLTIFLCAAQVGSKYLINLLTKEKVNVHAKTTEDYPFGAGLSAIHLAGLKKHRELIQLFERQGMKVNEYDANGCRLIQRIILNKDMAWRTKDELIEFLISCNVNILGNNKDGLTVLEAAILFGDPILFNWVLHRVQQADPQFNLEETKLFATQHCQKLMVKLLNDPQATLLPLKDALAILEKIEPLNIVIYVSLARFYHLIGINGSRADQDYIRKAQDTYADLFYNCIGKKIPANVYAEYCQFAYLNKRDYYEVISYAEKVLSTKQDNEIINFSMNDRAIVCEELQHELDFFEALNISSYILTYYIWIKNSKNASLPLHLISEYLTGFAKHAEELQDALTYTLLGHAYKERELYQEAVSAYELAIKLYKPMGDKAEYLTAQRYLELTKPLVNSKLIVTEIRNDDDLFQERIFSGGLKLNSSRIEEAIADFNEAILLKPYSLMGYTHRTIARSYYSDKTALLLDINKMILLYPADPFNFADRGDAYYSLEKLIAAKADFERAIQINPNIPDFYQKLAKVKTNLFEFEAAINDLEKFLQLMPYNSLEYNQLGCLKNILGLYGEAIINLEKAIELFNPCITPRNDLAFACAMRGDYELGLEKVAEAFSLIGIDSDSYEYAEANYALAVIKRLQGDYDSALEHIDLAMKCNVTSIVMKFYEYYTLRAEILILSKKYELAVKALQRIINEEEENTVWTYALYGYALYHTGNSNEANGYLQQALACQEIIYPDLSYLWCGKLHYALGHKKQAFDGLAQALKVNPRGLYIYEARAELALLEQKFDLALADYNYLLEREPENVLWQQKLTEAKQKIATQPQASLAVSTLFTPLLSNNNSIFTEEQVKQFRDTVLFATALSDISVTLIEQTISIKFTDDVGLAEKIEILKDKCKIPSINNIYLKSRSICIDAVSIKAAETLLATIRWVLDDSDNLEQEAKFKQLIL
jgi:tetratricopeptide (TPR) repeat protein